MTDIKDYIHLIRPFQWYKNLVVFLALIFTANLFNADKLLLAFLGFISLCLISSSYYIINDIKDRKSDRLNPEKYTRPVALGKVSIKKGIFISMFLLFLSLLIANYLGIKFFILLLILFIFVQLYSFFLKNIIFLDVICISINFVIKAMSGAFIIDVKISEWLIIGIFFFAFFLSISKRYSELYFLKEKAKFSRSSLKHYDENILKILLIVSMSLLLMCFSLYTFDSQFKGLIYTLPLFLFLILRYFYLTIKGSKIARHPHLFIKDEQLLIISILFLLISLIIINSEILFIM